MKPILRAAREAAIATAVLMGGMSAIGVAIFATAGLFRGLFGEAWFGLGGLVGLTVAIFVAATIALWWQEREMR